MADQEVLQLFGEALLCKMNASAGSVLLLCSHFGAFYKAAESQTHFSHTGYRCKRENRSTVFCVFFFLSPVNSNNLAVSVLLCDCGKVTASKRTELYFYRCFWSSPLLVAMAGLSGRIRLGLWFYTPPPIKPASLNARATAEALHSSGRSGDNGQLLPELFLTWVLTAGMTPSARGQIFQRRLHHLLYLSHPRLHYRCFTHTSHRVRALKTKQMEPLWNRRHANHGSFDWRTYLITHPSGHVGEQWDACCLLYNMWKQLFQCLTNQELHKRMTSKILVFKAHTHSSRPADMERLYSPACVLTRIHAHIYTCVPWKYWSSSDLGPGEATVTMNQNCSPVQWHQGCWFFVFFSQY